MSALHRALAALLGLPDAAALPAALSLADAVLLTVDPQAIIQREWVRCDEAARMFRAIRALGLIALYPEAWDAYARAMRARRRAGAKPREWYGVGAIRRLSPTLLVPDAALAGACPVLAEVRS